MSPGRPIALFAACMTLATSTLSAQTIATYAPGSHRYHLMSVFSRDQEQDGQHSKSQITNQQILSVILAAHAKDTLDFSYTMDSSAVSANPPIPLPDVSGMKGTQVRGAMSRSGKIYRSNSTADENDPDMQTLVEGMRRFLVTLPPGASVGNKWVDTVRNSTEGNGSHLDVKTITTSTILGDTTYEGQHAWRVHRAANLSIAGTQSALGQDLTVEGHGTGDGVYYISGDGVYIGSTATQTMLLKVTQVSTGKTIPVTQVVTSKVELMP